MIQRRSSRALCSNEIAGRVSKSTRWVLQGINSPACLIKGNLKTCVLALKLPYGSSGGILTCYKIAFKLQ